MTERDQVETALRERASERCELCSSTDALTVHEVPSGSMAGSERCVLLCATCERQVGGHEPLDPKRWFCLQEAAWSEVPAVQVTSYRLLTRLTDEPWARELLEQLYLDDETLAWAQAINPDPGEGDARPRTVDSNGVELADGDSVTLIKDLDVKGAGFVAKRGTLVKGIRLTDQPGHVDGRVNKVAIVLKTQFLKKV